MRTEVRQAAERRVGAQSIAFAHPPSLRAVGSVVGPKEGEGPLGGLFDRVWEDGLAGEKSWERAEVRLLESAVETVLRKGGLERKEIDFFLAGDLLNQIVASTFAARSIDLPFFGVYGACSTWTEALTLAAILCDGGFALRVIAAVSSHHETAERQYRFPVELAIQRPPTATWTATGAAAAVIEAGGTGPRVTHATVGRVIDYGEKDPYNMGTAMAPAAAAAIAQHFEDLGRSAEDYDLVVTGDLGRVGLPICADLLRRQGHRLDERLKDCGILLYDEAQGVGGGGSGCACSGATFAAYLYPRLQQGELRRLLLVSTGALLSPTSYQQGESIPGIAYAVAIEAGEAEEGGEAGARREGEG